MTPFPDKVHVTSRDNSEPFTYGPTEERRDDWVRNAFHVFAKVNDISIFKLSCRVRPVEVIFRVAAATSQ